MKYCILDIETDGLLDQVTKIHCLSFRIYDSQTVVSEGSITDYEQIKRFVASQEVLVGHNIIRYDIPVLEKILGIENKAKLIDTLGISWYQYPVPKFKHGLAYWGERLGFGKPVVEDWKDQPIEVYINRCESDVEINSRLFHLQMDYSMSIYQNLDDVLRLYAYLGFKIDCLKDQEEQGIDLDVRLAEESKFNLEFEIDEKIDSLSKNMPKELGKVLKKKPKVPYKQDGTLSVHGENWFKLLKEKNLPEDTEVIRELPNPGSPTQLKEWLFSLGWKPQTFKVSKNTGQNLPQVSLPFGAGLCPSVKNLFEENPYLEDLDGLYKAQHRYGLFKSFLENKDENNKVYSTAHGLTNTLRLQHSKPIVNLPGVNKWYGKEIRGVLTVPNDNYIMCGSDISGLEDNTKQHYIYFYDPDYVNDMRVPGFDPHIDIAVLGEMITKEDEDFFKWYNNQSGSYEFSEEEKQRMKSIKKIRGQAKVVNFSATYGAGPPKIAKTLDSSLELAKKLHTTYWKRNLAVKQTAKDVQYKTVNCKFWLYKDIEEETEEGVIIVKKLVEINQRQKWLYNPVSQLWYFLKADKDKFSTLNQGTGVYVFDSWLMEVRNRLKVKGIKVIMQYHDELLLICRKEEKEEVENILKQSMEETNNLINLNVKINISVDWGKNYAECH